MLEQAQSPHALWRLPRLGHDRHEPGDLDLALLFAVRGHGSGGFPNLKGALAALLKYHRTLKRTRQEFRIAVAGRVGAGKSTLLSAIFGGQLHFPGAATVCTGVPIRVVRGEQGTRLRVTFKDGSYEIRQGADELPNYAVKDGSRAQDVESLYLEWGHEGFPAGLEVLDTPGSQDPSQLRDVLASKAVQQADLLLYALAISEGGTLQITDFEALRAFRKAQATRENGASLLVVLTMADTIKSPNNLTQLLEQAKDKLKIEDFAQAKVVPCSALASLSALRFHRLEHRVPQEDPDLHLVRRIARKRLVELGVRDPQERTLGNMIRAVQIQEGFTACFDTIRECDDLECAWFHACASGRGHAMAPGVAESLPEDWLGSATGALREVGALRKALNQPEEPQVDPVQTLWHVSNLGAVLRFLDGAWERKLDQAETEIRTMLKELAKGSLGSTEDVTDSSKLKQIQYGPSGLEFVRINPHYAWIGLGPSKKKTDIEQFYYIAKTPVTEGLWSDVFGQDCLEDERNRMKAGMRKEAILDFIGKLNKQTPMPGWTYRLPNAQEWEAAAQAGSSSEWCFGNEVRDLEDYAQYGNFKLPYAGRKKPNAFGLYDMHGGVEEVVTDKQDYFTCGGCIDSSPDEMRSGVRNRWDGCGDRTVGFRLVLAPSSS